MTPERIVSLPTVPATVEDVHGHPRFGTYQGELNEVALERLRGPYSLPLPFRLVKHKRWNYAQVVTPEVIVIAAVADFTYTSNAFIAAVDLRSRKVLFDEGYLGVPPSKVRVSNHPGAGLEASFNRPGVKLEMKRGRSDDRYQVDVQLGSLLPIPEALESVGFTPERRARASERLERLGLKGTPLGAVASAVGIGEELRWTGEVVTRGAAPALTVISPVEEDGVINVTQKRAGLLSLGTLKVGRKTYSLDGGVAGLDYTHGYLARHTAWRWAMGNGRLADGTTFGFNLVEGFNDHNSRCNENALWIGDRLIPLARARFHFDKHSPEKEWVVETADKGVSLRFQPIHLHREERDYKLVRSHFVQPLGVFSGTMRVDGRVIEVKDVGGVTEDQDILW